MSVTLLFSYPPYASGATVTLDRATEAALVQQGRATYTSNPGPVFAPLTAVEEQALRDFLPSGQALVSGERNFATSTRKGKMRFGRAASSTGQSTASAVRTSQQAWRFPFDVYGFRLGYETNLAAAVTFSLVKGAILNTAGLAISAAYDEAANAHTYTPFNILWNSGSAGATIPARTGADTPALLWSDYVYQPAAAGQLILQRTLWPNPAATYFYPLSSIAMTPAEVVANNPGMSTLHWQNAPGTDNVTAWSAFSAANTAAASTNLSIPFIEVLTSRRVMSVAAVGDSHFAGQVDTGAVPLTPVWAACEAESSASLQFVPICRGWGGLQPYQYYAYALDLIANFKPDILFWQVWSQNDTTQGDNTQELALAFDIVDRCKAAGIVPILVTGVPINGGNSGMDTARKALNAVIRASGEIISDRDAVISDGASPVASYLPAYSAGVHPNAAGYAAYLTVDRVALRQAAGRA